MRKITILDIIGLCLFWIIFFFAFFKEKDNKVKIKKSHHVVCGKVLSITGFGSTLPIWYEYYFNGQKYSFNKSCKPPTKKRYESGIKDILIAIENGNSENNYLIEDEEDFAKINIIPSDTLGLNCNCVFKF